MISFDAAMLKNGARKQPKSDPRDRPAAALAEKAMGLGARARSGAAPDQDPLPILYWNNFY
jgi:hypothetical protein